MNKSYCKRRNSVAFCDFIAALSRNNFKKTVFLKQKNSFFDPKKTLFSKLFCDKAAAKSDKAKIYRYLMQEKCIYLLIFYYIDMQTRKNKFYKKI